MSKRSPLEETYWYAKQRAVRGYENGMGVPTVFMIELAYDRLMEQMERAIKLEKALKEIQSDASSYMGNPAAQRLYEIANKALEGESE